MFIWPVVFIVVVAVALFQLNAMFPDAMRQDGSWERLVYLGVLFLFLVVYGYRFSRVRAYPMFKIGLVWAALFSAAIIGYSEREAVKSLWANFRGEVMPTIAVARAEGEVELRKAWDGHFRAVSRVNGANVGMLIDTGASIVLLTHEDAIAVGLNPDRLKYDLPVTTANGRAYVAPVMLETITIGAVGLDNVRAAVAKEGAVHSSLLGMSFLGRLQETSFRRDRLILKN
ncbi:MAG: TIGR02281 family clan AA aspartic protease [Pseudomonadota bacterium]